MERTDHPHAVMLHKDAFYGGKALIVLGGQSAKDWISLKDEINPDCVLIANGGNAIVKYADYWMVCENMKWANKMAMQGDKDGIQHMEWFHRDAGAKIKLVSHHSWGLLRDTKNCISIRRKGYNLDEIPKDFTFRDYGEGYLAGGIFKHKEAWQTLRNGSVVQVRAGTVGLQLIHHAGILGVSEIHTIGFDLMFKGNSHHAYPHPVYKADKFRTEQMFVEYNGAKTMWAWIETAEYLKGIEWIFKKDNLRWIDHSDGLLKLQGLECSECQV